MKKLPIKDFFIGPKEPLVVISGPCVIESESHALETAEELKEIFQSLELPLIYKSSYDKANRSSVNSYRGPGIEKGLYILEKIKKQYDLPILTDVHTPEEAEIASHVCDIIQIPAFLCRQTDLLLAAGKTGKVVNVKKGQFLSPWDMKNVVDKLLSTNNPHILLTERGASLGYNNLVTDMRSIPIMQSLGFPVCFDASHSVQLPGAMGDASGGQREFIPTLVRAAIAAGANCLFLESHPDPATAKSDGASVYPMKQLKKLIQEAKRLYECVQAL